MAAAQWTYAKLLDLSMRSTSELNLRHIKELSATVGELRQLLSCVVCCQLLMDPYLAKGRRCDHFVCRLCVRGTKRLIPKCSRCNDCSDYKVYEEDRAMALQLLCYKTLCVRILQSSLYPQLEELRPMVKMDITKPSIKLPSMSTQEFIREGSQYDDVRDTFLIEPDFSFLKTLTASLPAETPPTSSATTPELSFEQHLPEQMSISEIEIEAAATAEESHHQLDSPIPLLPTGSRIDLQHQVIVTKASSVLDSSAGFIGHSWNEVDLSSALNSLSTLLPNQDGGFTYVLNDSAITSFNASQQPLLIGQLVQIDNSSQLPQQVLVHEEQSPGKETPEKAVSKKPVIPAETKSSAALAKKQLVALDKEKPVIATKPIIPVKKTLVIAAKEKTLPSVKEVPVTAGKEDSNTASKGNIQVAIKEKQVAIVKRQDIAAKEMQIATAKKEDSEKKEKQKIKPKNSASAQEKQDITTKEKKSITVKEKPTIEFKEQLAAAVKERETMLTKEKDILLTKEKKANSTDVQEKPVAVATKEKPSATDKDMEKNKSVAVRIEEPLIQISTTKRKRAQIVEEEKEEKSSSHMTLRNQKPTIVSSVQMQPPCKDVTLAAGSNRPRLEAVTTTAPVKSTKVTKASEAKKRKHCRCGISGPSTLKTCRNNRCWCYINGNSCSDCVCQGCNNPHKQDYIDTDDEVDDEENELEPEPEPEPEPQQKSITVRSASAMPPQTSNKGVTLVALSNPEQSQHPLVLVQNENNEMQCFNIFQDDVPVDPANYGFQRVQLQNKDSNNRSIPQYAYMFVPQPSVSSNQTDSQRNEESSPESKKYKSVPNDSKILSNMPSVKSSSKSPVCPGDSVSATDSAHSLFEDIMSGSDDL